MFLWCRLPGGIDATEIAKAALAQDIVLAPGNVFSPSRSAQGFLRFNASQPLDERVFDFSEDKPSPKVILAHLSLRLPLRS